MERISSRDGNPVQEDNRSRSAVSGGSNRADPLSADGQENQSHPHGHENPSYRWKQNYADGELLREFARVLSQDGLGHTNIIFGVSFANGRNLHDIGDGLVNPYKQAMSIIGKTLASFDEHNLISCFGFGDESTRDQDVFSFSNDVFCHGIEGVLRRYEEIVPHLRLGGPVSFVPVIEMAMTIAQENVDLFHVLIIIADGQCARFSPEEERTIEAIVKASELPLSIIFVGVGDGPWDQMEEFDVRIPARVFDNFRFVNMMKIMSEDAEPSLNELKFAIVSLRDTPSHFKATVDLNLLCNPREDIRRRLARPAPIYDSALFRMAQQFSRPGSNAPPYHFRFYNTAFRKTPAPLSPDVHPELCKICSTNKISITFGCGHPCCMGCAEDLQTCHRCESPIKMRLRIY